MISLVMRCDGCKQNSIVAAKGLGEGYLKTMAKTYGWTTDKTYFRILGEDIEVGLHYCQACSKIKEACNNGS
jgi:hypothetical protein